MIKLMEGTFSLIGVILLISCIVWVSLLVVGIPTSFTNCIQVSVVYASIGWAIKSVIEWSGLAEGRQKDE